ncbi:MAG TPA: hypothetical protein VIC56_01205 [Gemmatimonadota bacterium]
MRKVLFLLALLAAPALAGCASEGPLEPVGKPKLAGPRCGGRACPGEPRP